MNKAIKITGGQLLAAGACEDQRKLFKEHFGVAVVVTPTCFDHVADIFSWNWAARHLLSAPALAEYSRVHASARAEYSRVHASARAEYDRVRASAWAEYNRVCASTFARAYISDKVQS